MHYHISLALTVLGELGWVGVVLEPSSLVWGICASAAIIRLIFNSFFCPLWGMFPIMEVAAYRSMVNTQHVRCCSLAGFDIYFFVTAAIAKAG